jgi:hypothetical protein
MDALAVLTVSSNVSFDQRLHHTMNNSSRCPQYYMRFIADPQDEIKHGGFSLQAL